MRKIIINIIIIIIIIIIIMALQPSVRPWSLFQFLDPIHPDGKTHNQIDHILLDRRWHSSIFDVR
jgi:hypothetical protein